MARDPKEWAAEIIDADRDDPKLCVGSTYDDGILCEDRLADLIREAQEDGAAEWKTNAAEIGETVALMTTEAAALRILVDVKDAEIADLRSRLSNVASTAQAASNGWEPTQGLEAIYHIATTEPESASEESGEPGKKTAEVYLAPGQCLACGTSKDVVAGLCDPCVERGELPF